MAQLQRDIRTPIATGERLLSRFEYRELLENGGCRIIQPDLMHAGGFTEIRKIAALADMYSIPVAPHNPGGPICTAAAMHLAAAIPNFLILEQMSYQDALGASQRTVQRALVELEADGRVRSIGRARAQRWLSPPLSGFTTILLLPAALPFE